MGSSSFGAGRGFLLLSHYKCRKNDGGPRLSRTTGTHVCISTASHLFVSCALWCHLPSPGGLRPHPWGFFRARSHQLHFLWGCRELQAWPVGLPWLSPTWDLSLLYFPMLRNLSWSSLSCGRKRPDGYCLVHPLLKHSVPTHFKGAILLNVAHSKSP